jgi:hypothetical protein
MKRIRFTEDRSFASPVRGPASCGPTTRGDSDLSCPLQLIFANTGAGPWCKYQLAEPGTAGPFGLAKLFFLTAEADGANRWRSQNENKIRRD